MYTVWLKNNLLDHRDVINRKLILFDQLCWARAEQIHDLALFFVEDWLRMGVCLRCAWNTPMVPKLFSLIHNGPLATF